MESNSIFVKNSINHIAQRKEEQQNPSGVAADDVDI